MITQTQPPVPRRDGTAPPAPPPPRGTTGRAVRARRRLLYGLLAVAVVAAGAVVMRPSPMEVEIAPVVRGRLLVTVEGDGVMRVAERFTIAAPVTGRLARLTAREGDRVAAGEVVARLTPVPVDPRSEAQARAHLASAQSVAAEAAARVEQARAASLQASREAARRRVLEGGGALSREQLEQAELAAVTAARELEAAQAAARAAGADVAAARAALLDASPSAPSTSAKVEVRAPAAGRVLRVPDRSERVVAAGTPLLEVGDAAALELVVDLLSTDAVRVRPGAPLLATDWGGADTLRGTVRYLEPAAFTRVSALGVEEQRVNVVGDLERLPPGLGDGYRVEVAAVVSEAVSAVKAPTSALFEQDGAWYVFVVEEGRARVREVMPGRRGAGETELLRGLAPGERVIRYPADELVEGARVRGTS